MSAPPSSFPARLSFLMTEAGFTQRELARLVGVAHATVAGWRRGSIPQRRILELLGNRLNVSSEWLEHGQGEMRLTSSKPGKMPSREKASRNSATIRAEYLQLIQAYKAMASDLRLLADRYEQKATQSNREMNSKLEQIGRDFVAKTMVAQGGKVNRL